MGKRWWWIMKGYEKWFFRRADEILFVSPEDEKFAIEQWEIKKEKCVEVAFGVEISEFPRDKHECSVRVKSKHHIGVDERVLLFNGLLDYKPNLDALMIILNEINPRLLQQQSFRYKILICGKRLPEELNGLKNFADKNLIYAGFVDDIEMYFKGADLFLNPVQTGGGIKTKMVESIAFGTTVVTTKTGAAGIYQNKCGSKLVVVADDDWNPFTSAIVDNVDRKDVTPSIYYEYYYWGNIIRKVVSS
jgi:glycosyltransferase involved in cell wall biosynthesis